MFSNREKQKEATREISYRQFVYSNRVEAGKMKKKVAERYIALMQEIAADYAKLAEADELEERLL